MFLAALPFDKNHFDFQKSTALIKKKLIPLLTASATLLRPLNAHPCCSTGSLLLPLNAHPCFRNCCFICSLMLPLNANPCLWQCYFTCSLLLPLNDHMLIPAFGIAALLVACCPPPPECSSLLTELLPYL
jgi:hypothetical protein